MSTHEAVEEYYHAVLRKAVASQCQLVGWQYVSSTALDLLVDLMRHHLMANARRTASYCQLSGRTSALLQDAQPVLASGIFQLHQFISTVETPNFSGLIPPALPVPRASNFNFLRPGSQEIVTRPIHIHEHLPPMLFDGSAASEQSNKKLSGGEFATISEKSPVNEGMAELTRQPDLMVTRRSRVASAEHDSKHLIDLVSVMMTTSGFISTSVEGKLPDTTLPEDSSDHGDGHGKLKTRKQKADTYRRLSERENERKCREQELWSSHDDPFDIIDVKVDDDVNSSVSSPEKSVRLKTVDSMHGIPLKKRSTPQLTSKFRRDMMKRKEKYAPKQDGKNKLSIFRKKARKNLKRLHSNIEKQVLKEDDNAPLGSLDRDTGTPPSPMGATEKAVNVSHLKSEPTENPVVPCGSVQLSPSLHETTAVSVDTKNEDSPLRTALHHEINDASNPDHHEFLNNPLIPRFSFPFAPSSESSSLTPRPTFPPLLAFHNIEGECSSSQPPIETRPLVSPVAESDGSVDSVSLSSPPKRTPGSALTPLERLEMADRAEKKRDREHKKNKKDKKDKKKKEKKDKERKEKDDKYDKKKKRSSQKTVVEDDIVPKLTVRLTGRELSTDIPCSESQSTSPRISMKNLKEDSPNTSRKEKLPKKIGLDTTANSHIFDSSNEDTETVKPSKESKVDKGKTSAGRRKKVAAEADDLNTLKSAPTAVITETVGSYIDNEGNQVWICPTCGRQDDGSPMIGCDKCDDWYHWVCVGIQVPPDQHEDWFCPRCSAKQHESSGGKRGRVRSRKKH